jgi:hypothetical protein
MKKNETMDVVFLLDRSGSMSGTESDTIGGYNGYIKKMKDKNAKVTTVLFDDQYEMITDRVDIKEIKNMTNKVYYTRGCTALMDAIGKTIKYLDSKNPKKVVFIITTDGLENASREYNKQQVKELIEGHKDWEFMYLGANIDSYGEASSIGIRADRTSNYSKSKKGMAKMFESLACASACIAEDRACGAEWKAGLEDYINENQQ